MFREAAVAGRFYPGQREALQQLVDRLLLPAEELPAEELPARGIMVPHAGYVYSGGIAGATFSRVKIPPTVILLGPNHHGLGARAALAPAGSWSTPLGEIPIAAPLSDRLLAAAPLLQSDPQAHRFEHSLEVQLPFLQRRHAGFTLVALCIGQLALPQLLELGTQLGQVLATEQVTPLLVASSDMTHYEPGAVARIKDERALERVLALDPVGLYHTVRDYGITMCGVLPTVIMLAAAKELGATSAELVRYGNSGEVTGDQSEVVGYAGVVVR